MHGCEGDSNPNMDGGPDYLSMDGGPNDPLQHLLNRNGGIKHLLERTFYFISCEAMNAS